MTIVRNDTKNFYVMVEDENGDPFNLTNYTAVFTARSSYSEANPAIESDGVISAPATGRIDFELTPTDTDVNEGVYKYDIQIDISDDPKYTPVRNQELTITQGVTQT